MTAPTRQELAVLYREYNLSNRTERKGEVCPVLAQHPVPDGGTLACWRSAGHGGLHWDDVEKMAWNVPRLVKTAGTGERRCPRP